MILIAILIIYLFGIIHAARNNSLNKLQRLDAAIILLWPLVSLVIVYDLIKIVVKGKLK